MGNPLEPIRNSCINSWTESCKLVGGIDRRELNSAVLAVERSSLTAVA